MSRLNNLLTPRVPTARKGTRLFYALHPNIHTVDVPNRDSSPQ
jgi:hypothetical protein